MDQWEDTADLAGTEEFAGIETLPKGLYLVSVKKNELGMSKGDPEQGQHPKLKADVQFEVIAPVEKAGAPVFENFTLATNDLPTRYDKTTVGARRWVTMMNKANVPTATLHSLRMAAETSKGCQLIIDIDTYEDTYKGVKRERNNIKGFYTTSERQPQFRGGAPVAAPVAAAAPIQAPPATPPVQNPAMVPPPGPPAPMPTAPAAAPVAAPAPVPSAPPAPPAAPPAAPPVAAAPAPAAGAEPQVPCYSCNPPTSVPVSQYQQHMKEVHGQG
jgi:hypothetical protein